MYSSSKTIISPDVAQAIFSQHMGGARKITFFQELKDGFFNAAYRVDLEDGQKCVMKVAPAASVKVLRYEQGIMSTEVEVMRLVKACTEMPVPTVLCHDSTRRIVENEYFVMEFLDGVPLNKLRTTLSVEEQYQIDAAIGKYMRQMNEIEGDRFGYFTKSQPRFSGWSEAFDYMLHQVMLDGEDMRILLPITWNELSFRVAKQYPVLDEITHPALVHWDLWDGNIFVNQDTRQISGIVDFERALWGDPLMECNFGAFGNLPSPALLSGYGKNMLETESEKMRRILYNIYLYLIMVIECTFRNYETKDQENWARAMLGRELAKLEG